jgi:hypothetical protein
MSRSEVQREVREERRDLLGPKARDDLVFALGAQTAEQCDAPGVVHSLLLGPAIGRTRARLDGLAE